ncbi:MAG: hypothetical protein FP814_01095 [Desulfobacterium sp.]|nr:hypothetical protein [Desulfobacterium sp.]MBU3950429.1 hypothetical protein [Pseudomonadota bacterium]MBU4009645.1 hypothetical protein [Pseudomonadota bacterium]MBU4037330.1 hypothetical protein [Pseudomonadota bacterium]
MWNKVLNIIMMRSQRAKNAADNFLQTVQSEKAEGFLEVLLNLMSLVLYLDKDFRKNIKNFNARYLFCSQDRKITVAAIFNDNNMKVSKKEIDNTNITVIFRNGKSLMGFLLSPKPDILGSLLSQDITIDGNLNYIYKFAYMSKHLQLKYTGKL